MQMIQPFRATRPTRDKAYLVATRSYVSYNPTELEDKLENNPFTFLHVINPSAQQNAPLQERFEAVRDRFDMFCEEEIFVTENNPSYFIYEQRTPNDRFLGVIGLLPVDQVKEGHVIKHEKTIEHREELFSQYLETTGFQAEPVLVFGDANQTYHEILAQVMLERPEYEFSSTDRYEHRLWFVPGTLTEDLKTALAKVQEVYIADGHHRLASSVRVGDRLNDNSKAQGVLTMFMDESGVSIASFERWFRLEEQQLELKELQERFYVEKVEHWTDEPKGDFEMYHEGSWYVLTSKLSIVPELKAQLLLDEILRPLLGVLDERNDSRLKYIRQDGTDQSARMVEKGYQIGFRLPPVSVELLKNIGSAGGVMPPKSTYIEPKLRSGLLLHVFK